MLRSVGLSPPALAPVAYYINDGLSTLGWDSNFASMGSVFIGFLGIDYTSSILRRVVGSKTGSNNSQVDSSHRCDELHALWCGIRFGLDCQTRAIRTGYLCDAFCRMALEFTRTVYVPAQCTPLPAELTQPLLVPLPPPAD
ncbi:phage holin family protein [Pectobacterium polaris]|uniref:phage holin family protein n=1 Tax=Pectobacterium TaxID=122277 RepID=UPI003D9BDE11